MKKRNMVIAGVMAFVLVQAPLVWATVPAVPTTMEAVTLVADRLIEYQLPAGSDAGSWRDDQEYTGSIVAGLSEAYRLTGRSEYKTAAEAGGDWILRNATSCNMYGDEAYALMKLSQNSCDPLNNKWRTALTQLFTCIHNQPAYPPDNVGGTAGYIEQYAYSTIVTTATFYIAHHTVAAYYVNATDKVVWRTYLIRYLSQIDDDAEGNLMPVLALGTATWALAATGPLDNTAILPPPGGFAAEPFRGKRLKDLPAMLKSHVSTEFLNPTAAGNFFWRFDHKWGVGYTEDDIFGLLGLIYSQKQIPTLGYTSTINLVRSNLMDAIDVNTVDGDPGAVYAHVDWYPEKGPMLANPYHHMAGELLTALGAAAIQGDINLDDKVNLADLAQFADQWLDSSAPCIGNGIVSDLNKDGRVNFTDFALMAQSWGNHL
jgi:hypothetical protein